MNVRDETNQLRLDLLSEFGSLLRRTRQYRGLTQPALARRADVAQGAVVRIEAGERLPSLATYQALLNALGVAWDARDPLRAVLAEGSGEAPRAPSRPRGRRSGSRGVS